MHYINSKRNRKKRSRPRHERRLDPLEPLEPLEREGVGFWPAKHPVPVIPTLIGLHRASLAVIPAKAGIQERQQDRETFRIMARVHEKQ
jgi:hypothetical protein